MRRTSKGGCFVLAYKNKPIQAVLDTTDIVALLLY